MSSPRRVTPVGAVNRMTRRWIEDCGDASSAFCAPSAWPLLALLADAADGRGRRELEDAVGLPAAECRAAALDMLDALRGMTAVRAALGLWAQERFPLAPAWTAGLPLGTVGLLTGDPAVDTPLLDGWARQHTDGLVEAMPVRVDRDLVLLLAGAMSVRTRWVRPFSDWGMPMWQDAGPWKNRRYHVMHRITRILDRVTVASTDHGEVTCLEILGKDGISVHLVIGEEGRSASEVLQGGLVGRSGRGRKGGTLRVGDTAPGLTVEAVRDDEPDDRLLVLVPRFRVEGDHDLLEQPQVFGLDAVTDTTRGHFPAISSLPLAVSQARQSAVAVFNAEGFEAAAVTVVGLAVAGVPPVPPRRVKQVRVEFDRPFGFFASHRTTGLILAAGWVAQPELHEGPGFDDELDALLAEGLGGA
jgi:serine protease inhibitor